MHDTWIKIFGTTLQIIMKFIEYQSQSTDIRIYICDLVRLLYKSNSCTHYGSRKILSQHFVR